MKKIIILIGPPGSGKGTQADTISERYNYCHVSTGQLLRVLSTDANLDLKTKKAAEKIKQGKMAPDWIIYQLSFAKIEKCLKDGMGVLLDGAIRNLKQAKAFQTFLAQKDLAEEIVVLYIYLSDKDSLDRLTHRRVCEVCGANVPWLAETKNLTACAKCGGKLITRMDDDIKIIKNRIKKQGEKALSPIVKYYTKMGLVKQINGNQSIENVWRDMDQALKN